MLNKPCSGKIMAFTTDIAVMIRSCLFDSKTFCAVLIELIICIFVEEKNGVCSFFYRCQNLIGAKFKIILLTKPHIHGIPNANT